MIKLKWYTIIITIIVQCILIYYTADLGRCFHGPPVSHLSSSLGVETRPVYDDITLVPRCNTSDPLAVWSEREYPGIYWRKLYEK